MNQERKLATFLQTLGVENRLRIIACIGTETKSVGEICKRLGLSQPLVSHHLKAMRENQILVTERKGAFIYYRLKNEKLLGVLGALSQIAYLLRDESIKRDRSAARRGGCDYWSKLNRELNDERNKKGR